MEWLAFTGVHRAEDEDEVEFAQRIKAEASHLEASGYTTCYQWSLDSQDALIMCTADENGCFIRR